MNILKKITKIDICVTLAFAFIWLLAPDVQSLAATIGERVSSIGNEFNTMKEAFVNIALIIGIVLSIIGLTKFLKASRGGEGGVGEGVKYLVVGVALIALKVIISLTSNTVTGQDATF